MASKKMLLVTTDAKQQEFGELASAEGIEWIGVTTCSEARDLLAASEEFSTVVTDGTLPDGNWYSLLQEVVSRAADLNVVVVLPAGSDPTSVKSCGAEVVEYPLDAAGRRLLVETLRGVQSRAAVG